VLGRIADFFGFITEHVNLPAVGVAIVFVIWVAVFFVISRIFRAKDKFTISYSRHSIRVRGSANIPKQAKAAGTEIHEHLITLGRIAAVSGLEAVEPETRYLEVRLRGAAIEPGNEIQVRCRIPR